jgi:hypothetical protein
VRAVRKIPAECKDAFAAAVAALRKLGKTDVAIEAVMKVARDVCCAQRLLFLPCEQSGDVKLLCELYVECGKWQEAFKVADSNSELLKMVHAQHAAHLVQHDRFEDAMQVTCRVTHWQRRVSPPATRRLSWSQASARTPLPCSCSCWSVLCSNRCVL